MMLAMYAARALSAGKTLHHYVELLLPDQHTTIGGAAGGGGKAIGCGKLIGDLPLPNGTTSRIKLENVYYGRLYRAAFAPGLSTRCDRLQGDNREQLAQADNAKRCTPC